MADASLPREGEGGPLAVDEDVPRAQTSDRRTDFMKTTHSMNDFCRNTVHKDTFI